MALQHFNLSGCPETDGKKPVHFYSCETNTDLSTVTTAARLKHTHTHNHFNNTRVWGGLLADSMKTQRDDFVANHQPAGDSHSTWEERTSPSGTEEHLCSLGLVGQVKSSIIRDDYLPLQWGRPPDAPQGRSTYWEPQSLDLSKTSISRRSSEQPEQTTIKSQSLIPSCLWTCVLLFWLRWVRFFAYLQDIEDNVDSPLHFGLLCGSWFDCKWGETNRARVSLVVVHGAETAQAGLLGTLSSAVYTNDDKSESAFALRHNSGEPQITSAGSPSSSSWCFQQMYKIKSAVRMGTAGRNEDFLFRSNSSSDCSVKLLTALTPDKCFIQCLIQKLSLNTKHESTHAS